ncbi:MAG TPA: LysR family transcriptional regulator, partial [Pseudomonadaceae bacterium]|nr:LysR family transcriptional regulator [Pseudomonadaceae bacterium]
APDIRIEIFSPTVNALSALEHGEIDFLLTPEQFVSNEHPQLLLFEEKHVIVGCETNPLFQDTITESVFFEQGQVIMGVGHAQAFAEREMGELNRKRRIDIVCSSFLAVPWMLPNTQRIAIMHERLAKLMVKQLPLTMAPLPFEFPVMRELVQYHSIKADDGGIQWMLQALLDQAALLRQ